MTDPLDGAKYRLLCGDAGATLATLPDECVSCVVTSPPFFQLRDYQTARWEGGDPACGHAVRPRVMVASSTLAGGKATTGHQREGYGASCPRCGAVRVDEQIGLEDTVEAFVARLMEVFREVKRVLHPTGTLWLNLGETMSGGQCLGIPWRLAFALQADSWILRSEITLCKLSPMPESVRNRPTSATEKLFLLAKQPTYFYDAEAVRVPHVRQWDESNGGGWAHPEKWPEGSKGRRNGTGYPLPNPSGRNLWNYWLLNGEPSPYPHFAAFPTKLVEPCVAAGSRKGDVILDPFVGTGTTGEVALAMGRRFVGIDLSAEYLDIARTRLETLPTYTGRKKVVTPKDGQISLLNGDEP